MLSCALCVSACRLTLEESLLSRLIGEVALLLEVVADERIAAEGHTHALTRMKARYILETRQPNRATLL